MIMSTLMASSARAPKMVAATPGLSGTAVMDNLASFLSKAMPVTTGASMALAFFKIIVPFLFVNMLDRTCIFTPYFFATSMDLDCITWDPDPASSNISS